MVRVRVMGKGRVRVRAGQMRPCGVIRGSFGVRLRIMIRVRVRFRVKVRVKVKVKVKVRVRVRVMDWVVGSNLGRRQLRLGVRLRLRLIRGLWSDREGWSSATLSLENNSTVKMRSNRGDCAAIRVSVGDDIALLSGLYLDQLVCALSTIICIAISKEFASRIGTGHR